MMYNDSVQSLLRAESTDRGLITEKTRTVSNIPKLHLKQAH